MPQEQSDENKKFADKLKEIPRYLELLGTIREKIIQKAASDSTEQNPRSNQIFDEIQEFVIILL